MGHALHDLSRHNAWATAQLLEFCQNLDHAILHSMVPGTYGTILETLRHIVASEGSYLYRLTGEPSLHGWSPDDPGGFDVLRERAALLASTWEQLVAGEVDTERMGEARGDDGLFAVRAGVFITQAFHHANEHRAHVCTILGAKGHEPPDLSAWAYAITTGRSTRKT
jgi:uncharacterized damage-inducible protein DinB